MFESTSRIKSPDTINVKLEACCKQTLEKIKEKQE